MLFAASVKTAGSSKFLGAHEEVWFVGGLLRAKVFIERGELFTLDILTFIGVPQRGQLVRLGESGNSH